MDAYTSKNSQYFSRDGNIIREKDSQEEDWGNLWVYIPVGNIGKIAKQKKIKILQRPKLEESVAKEFMRALQDEEMDTTQFGGRIFVLKKTGKGYIPYWSGKIIKIGEYEPEINLADEPEFDLDNDKALNK